MSTPQNIFAGYNLADLTSLLQGRVDLAGVVAAAGPSTATGLTLNAQSVPNFLLAASTNAIASVGAPTSTRKPVLDPPGNVLEGIRGTHGAALSALTTHDLSAAVEVGRMLSGKRPMFTTRSTAEQAQILDPAAAKKTRHERTWDDMFAALVSLVRVGGNSTIHMPEYFLDDPELGLWVQEQRKRKLSLSPEERYKLDLIGFEWEPAATRQGAGSLSALALQVSSNRASPSLAANSMAGNNSVLDALEQYKQRLMIHATAASSACTLQPANGAPKQISEADAGQHWSRMFQKLQAHHSVHGHCSVALTNPEAMTLAPWVQKQRERYQLGTLSERHKALLDILDFNCDCGPMPSSTNSVSSTSTSSNTDETQRKNADSKERRRVRTFDENFIALLEYKKIHGDADVPQKYDNDRKLGVWVKNVRQHPQRHSEEQRARLDSIGFKWRKLQLDDQWSDAYAQLLEYKEKYGDCNVPSRWKKCPALARWVHTQRTMYRRNKLLDDRKEKLEDAGFVWDCNAMRDDEAFHENYEKLLAFKGTCGHCNVPNKYRRDRPLGRWAAKMRDMYCYDQLDADRKKALSDIGFVWKPPAVENDTPSVSGEAALSGTSRNESEASTHDYMLGVSLR